MGRKEDSTRNWFRRGRKVCRNGDTLRNATPALARAQSRDATIKLNEVIDALEGKLYLSGKEQPEAWKKASCDLIAAQRSGPLRTPRSTFPTPQPQEAVPCEGLGSTVVRSHSQASLNCYCEGCPEKFVLLELFTSGACSSSAMVEGCLVEWLSARKACEAVMVYPIAYHVDYWNELGWVDPFSSDAATRRQNWYGVCQGPRG